MLEHREFTLILYVNDIVWMLALLLNTVSKLELSVLTIHQIVPMEDKATITLSLSAKDTAKSIDEIIIALRDIEHVSKVELISMSM